MKNLCSPSLNLTLLKLFSDLSVMIETEEFSFFLSLSSKDLNVFCFEFEFKEVESHSI